MSKIGEAYFPGFHLVVTEFNLDLPMDGRSSVGLDIKCERRPYFDPWKHKGRVIDVKAFLTDTDAYHVKRVRIDNIILDGKIMVIIFGATRKTKAYMIRG